MSTPLRVGVVGAGAIAIYGHIPGYQKVDGVEVTAICDTNLDRARAVAARFNVAHAFDDYRTMLEQTPLDIVSVCVPNIYHAPVTLAALEAGAHVMCEKPLATTLEDGQAMVEAAERAGKLLAVNMSNRMRADTTTLRTVINNGACGTVNYVFGRMLRRSGIPGFGSWFTRKDLAGGGVLMDIGVHMLDLTLWVQGFPRVVGVRGEVQSIHGPRGRGLGGWGVDHIKGGVFDVDDFAALHLRLANGGLITVEVSWAIHGRNEFRLQVIGDEGGGDLSSDIYGNDAPLRLFREEGGIPSEVIPTLPRVTGSDWDRSMARFIEAIRTGVEPPATGNEAFEVLKLLLAAYRSSEERREIEIA